MTQGSQTEYRKIVRGVQDIVISLGNYHDHNFASNMVETVPDYHMQEEV